MTAIRALFGFIVRFVLGALFTLTPLSAILVVGWTQRAAARSVERSWSRRTGHGVSDGSPRWPRWILADDAGARFSQGKYLSALFGSLWANFRQGIAALVPVFIVTAPFSALWLLSWWAGWENSFNKGYEQAWVGPVVALTGIAYFLLLMTLLPLAQSRQALTGSWRTFFDIAGLRALYRESRIALIFLGILFFVAGFAVLGLKITPMPMGNQISDARKLEEAVGLYALIAGAVVFPLYVTVRLAAARIYAAAAIRLASKGEERFGLLSAQERALMEGYGIVPGEARRSGALVRTLKGSANLVGATATAVLMAIVWFGVVAQVYAGQFLNHNWIGWLNHPLIQLPWSLSPLN
jgi:hypothetical protein